MLRQLYIRNFALIDELDMVFEPGFSVITGETGAGKSIILGAIGLLLGQRADAKTLKQGADKCVIEAHFDLSHYDMGDFFEQNEIEPDAEDTIIRRELTAAGKSRAFVNDTPVALTVLRELGERLVDIHSQHQNLLLGKHDFQLSVVDLIAGDGEALETYRQRFADYQSLRRQVADMEEEIARNRQQAEFLQFQFDELQAARLVDGEQEELEQRSETMTHAEDIKQALYTAGGALETDDGGIVSQLRLAAAALKGVEHVYPDVAELAQRLESSYIELKDVAAEVNARTEDIDFDPAELEQVNVRLDRLYDLQKKYRVETVAALIEQRDSLEQKLSNIENSDACLAELNSRAAAALTACQEAADSLSQQRAQAAKNIEQQLRERLVPLGMPNVRFEVHVERGELTGTGQDYVSFLFSANTSSPLQPVSQVASGGEIARVMLAVKAMISGAVKLPTIIFDEIDTGVSGKIAEQMARMMAQMGQGGRQVISITHLPQIAAMGSTHYKVYKEETPQGTTTRMLQLAPDERVTELAQMLSGSAVSEAAIENAKQLLDLRLEV